MGVGSDDRDERLVAGGVNAELLPNYLAADRPVADPRVIHARMSPCTIPIMRRSFGSLGSLFNGSSRMLDGDDCQHKVGAPCRI